MAFQPATSTNTITMLKQDEDNGGGSSSSNNNNNNTTTTTGNNNNNGAHWQAPANSSCALALATATGANPSSSSLSSSSSSLSPSSCSPPSDPFGSPTSEHEQKQQAAITQERLANALLLHQHQLHQQQLQQHLQQHLQQQQQQRLFGLQQQRATSSASPAGSLEGDEDELSVRRIKLFRDFEAMAEGRKRLQLNSMDEDTSSNSSLVINHQADPMQVDSERHFDSGEQDEQETALNLSVNKKREPQVNDVAAAATAALEQNEDLKNQLMLQDEKKQQSLHAQLERQQREFQQASSRLYEHILACQLNGTKQQQQPAGGLLMAARSPSDSLTSNSATSPSALAPNFAQLLKQQSQQQQQYLNHHHHHQSSTSSSHHSHSSSSASSTSSFSSSGASVPESPTGYSPTSERNHLAGVSSSGSGSGSGSSSASGSTSGGPSSRPMDQLSPASAAAAAQRLHQHLLNFNSSRATNTTTTSTTNGLFVNQHPQHHQSEHSLQPRLSRELFFNAHNQPHNNLINVHHSQSNNHMNHHHNHHHHHHHQQLLEGNHPLLQHELGPVHKADADDLDRIRNFIEQFKARRGALGLTQKQAAQCFRAYTNDRYAFSDNFVGHFEGFQFRPQTAMTIADSLAEWLEFAEAETRQGRQLSFMPGKVKETRKRKYEVIRIRDSAKRVLVEAFERNRSPSTSELEQLSKRTNIPSRNIEIFFKNRRTSRQYHH